MVGWVPNEDELRDIIEKYLTAYLHLDQTTPQSIINGSASVIAPTSDLHIANKYYVDSNVDLDGGFANSVYLISQISDGGGA
jgi:hypothetical protein